MKLDFLFPRNDPGTTWRSRQEPSLAKSASVPMLPPGTSPSAEDAAGRALLPPRRRAGGATMSPRQLAEWAYEMYVSGTLDWDEYRIVGFPAELHPRYNTTIGALTGTSAAPDSPRDMIKEWEERLAFVNRHNNTIDPEVRRTEKILSLLRKRAKPAASRRSS